MIVPTFDFSKTNLHRKGGVIFVGDAAGSVFDDCEGFFNLYVLTGNYDSSFEIH